MIDTTAERKYEYNQIVIFIDDFKPYIIQNWKQNWHFPYDDNTLTVNFYSVKPLNHKSSYINEWLQEDKLITLKQYRKLKLKQLEKN